MWNMEPEILWSLIPFQNKYKDHYRCIIVREKNIEGDTKREGERYRERKKDSDIIWEYRKGFRQFNIVFEKNFNVCKSLNKW